MTIKLFLTAFLLIALQAISQIALDGTMGPAGELQGPDFSITSDLGKTVGTNLFHSFSEFNIRNGESATFSGPDSISNIFSRVTGGNPSNIDGLLRSTIPGADLFFMNPSGVIFGPNAQLDVMGSFTVNTAAYIELGEEGHFDASDPDNSLLTSAPPEAFGFLDNATPGISLTDSQLRVPQNQSLSMVGGDLQMTGGQMQAAGGQVNLVSVGSEGKVNIDSVSSQPALENNSFTELGDINMVEGATLNVDGAGGGGIKIRGQKLTMNNAKITSTTNGNIDGKSIDIELSESLEIINGGSISTNTIGMGKSGNIEVFAKVIEVFGSQSRISSNTTSFAANGGNGGNITIEAQIIEILNGGQISARTPGLIGMGGDIDITAAESILISGTNQDPFLPLRSEIGTESNGFLGSDSGGSVRINTNLLEIRDGAAIASTTVSGNAGNIEVSAEDISISDALSGIFSSSLDILGLGGSPGDILIGANTLLIVGGAVIDASTSTPFEGGKIDINASLKVEISGFRSKISSSSTDGLVPDLEGGKAGEIIINTESLEIMDQGEIITNTLGTGDGGDISIDSQNVTIFGFTSSISSRSSGSGTAGNVNISGRSLIISEGSISALSIGPGNGGNLLIDARNSINLVNASFISAEAVEKNGGVITIHSDRLNIRNSSKISAQAGLDGGAVTINSQSLVHLVGSNVTAEANNNGGNITIGSGGIILNNSQARANAIRGNGGNISITTDAFLSSSDSIIDASSEFGVSGIIDLFAPDIDIAGSLAVLPGLLSASELQLQPSCAVRSPEDVSTFTVRNREGVFIPPDDILPGF